MNLPEDEVPYEPSTHISGEHADLVHAVEIAASVGTFRQSRLRSIADLASAVIVVIALSLTFYTLISKDTQVKETAARSLCIGRYQDTVDDTGLQVNLTIGGLVVAITQTAPGPEREQAVAAKIAQLAAVDERAIAALDAKRQYNETNRPLPCPLD